MNRQAEVSVDTIGNNADELSPFHEGERLVQQRMGVRKDIEQWARQVVRPYMPEQHREFYAQLPFVTIAARDASGRPWATLLAGGPGFVNSPEPTVLDIAARPAAGDALSEVLETETAVGIVGLEFHTRRRNRVNGRLSPVDDTGELRLAVDQSFGNCPQYIAGRDWYPVDAELNTTASQHDVLTPAQREWIAQAETFFVASGYEGEDDPARTRGMDASHRGGESGFVRVLGDAVIEFPDYAGNNHYNTIGNLVKDPRIGLLFVDFESGHLLQISGRATIDWDSPAVATYPGARRLVRIDIEAIIELRDALPIRWRPARGAVRSLRVLDKRAESEDVTSFVLAARDGGKLGGFEPGQHLPIELPLEADGVRVERTYSISNAPGENVYRLSIKREPLGMASRFLHDVVEPGDFLDAQKPSGDFRLEPGTRPVVLVSAGVGLTPMVSMLGALAAAPESRPVWFIHGAADGAHHPLADEVRQLIASAPELNGLIAYSRPRPDDRPGEDFDHQGRVDAELIARTLPDLDADYYLCGPAGFMADITGGLKELGVDENRIRFENFGPVG